MVVPGAMLESFRRQSDCLRWVDQRLSDLISKFLDSEFLFVQIMVIVGAKMGFGSMELVILTLNVPLLMRVDGIPVEDKIHTSRLNI